MGLYLGNALTIIFPSVVISSLIENKSDDLGKNKVWNSYIFLMQK